MSAITIKMSDALYQYLLDHSLREPAILKALREATQTYRMAMMQISPEQGQFMALLVSLLGAKRTIDIGTFTGYSAMAVAKALPADGKVITCDIDKEATDIAKRYWEEGGVSNKIELKLGAAQETLEGLLKSGEEGQFDFVFIDADKANYLKYYELALKLLRQGGLVAIDNVLWDGKVIEMSQKDNQTKGIRAFNDFIKTDERVEISMIPIGDGLTLARKIA